jgi:1-acyl-sn-glycerol-3-phosphate acyltransferase
MFYSIVSVINWLFVLFTFITFFPVACAIWLLTVLIDKNLKLLHLFTSFWGVSFIWINPFLRIKIEGREKIQPGVTYVMVCNHQSMLDIMVLFRIFTHFKWVAKKELFKIPILGWTMTLNGYVKVDRAHKSSHIKMLKECENNLERGNSIMVFPEGTRSEDGQLQQFKEGAFKLALDAKKPILPIVLNGTSDSFPKTGIIFKKFSSIRIKILDPIDYASFNMMSSKELSLKVKDNMAQVLNQLQLENITK